MDHAGAIEERSLLAPRKGGAESPGGDQTFLRRLTMLAAISGFLFGYDTGVVSGALVLIADPDAFDLDEVQEETVVSATVGAAIVGALAGGPLNRRLGRRPVILASSMVFTVGALYLGLAQQYVDLVVGRVILGLGIGASSMTVPVYIAEAAPSDVRGRLITMNSLFITGGQFLSSVIDGLFSEVDDGWRFMFGFAALPALVQWIGFLSLPESPRWLLARGRASDARAVLEKLRGTSDVGEELDHVRAQLELETVQSSGGIADLFATPAGRRAALVGCSLQAIQQLAAINSVMYYAGSILLAAGFSSSAAIWLSVPVSFVNFAGTLVGFRAVETMGRRSLTLRSLGLVVLALCGLAGAFALASHESLEVSGVGSECSRYTSCFSCVSDSDCGFCSPDSCVPGDDDGSGECPVSADYHFSHCQDDSQWPAYLIMLGLMLYLAAFAPGIGTMPWTVNAEIYPLHLRSVGNSLSTATNWLGNLLVSYTFLSLMKAITPQGAWLVYAGVAALGWLLLYWQMPETKGVPLEEISALFERPGDAPARAPPTSPPASPSSALGVSA